MRDLIESLYEGTIFGELDEGVPYELDPDRKQASLDGGKAKGFVLSGRTYDLKVILKQAGAQYRPAEKVWTLYTNADNLLWSLAKRGLKIRPLYADEALAESAEWNRTAADRAKRDLDHRKRLHARANAKPEPEGIVRRGMKMVFGRWVKSK